MFDAKAFGEELAEVRQRMGFRTQSELVNETNISLYTISRIEQGYNVKLDSLVAYLEAVELDINDIFKE